MNSLDEPILSTQNGSCRCLNVLWTELKLMLTVSR